MTAAILSLATIAALLAAGGDPGICERAEAGVRGHLYRAEREAAMAAAIAECTRLGVRPRSDSAEQDYLDPTGGP